MKPSVFFYVQHLLGVGHQMRASQLARAMSDAGLDVHYVSGGFNDMDLDLGGATLHQLPPIRSADSSFIALINQNNEPVEKSYWQSRLTQMKEIVEKINPAAYLIEGFPFARRKFAVEILPLLEKAIISKTPVFCSIRDILVPSGDEKKTSLTIDQIKTYFSSVLIHGDGDFISLSASFPAADHILNKLAYTGYVAPAFKAKKRPDTGEIIVSAGGGAVGENLLMTAMESALMDGGQSWRFLLGPNLPVCCADNLRKKQRDNIIVETVRPDFRDLLSNAMLSISQAGYNTVMDVLVTKTPSVLVPFGSGRESEQPTRAKLLEKHKLAICLEEENLSATNLNEAIKQALLLPTFDAFPFALNGAETSAQLIMSKIKEAAR